MSKLHLLILIVPLLIVVPNAHAFVKFVTLPDTKAGSIVTATGTSAPSNETRTNCDVQLNVNGLGYQKVTPTGTNGSYTTWKYAGSPFAPTIHEGENKLTAKIECFPPAGGNQTMPNFVHHHSENVTGVA